MLLLFTMCVTRTVPVPLDPAVPGVHTIGLTRRGAVVAS